MLQITFGLTPQVVVLYCLFVYAVTGGPTFYWLVRYPGHPREYRRILIAYALTPFLFPPAVLLGMTMIVAVALLGIGLVLVLSFCLPVCMLKDTLDSPFSFTLESMLEQSILKHWEYVLGADRMG